MFGAIDDDDLEFNPAAGSKLASLFNFEKSPEKGNASLTYTAPKQPKNYHSNDDGSSSTRRSSSINNSTSASNKLSLVVAKTVTSFKLEDGNYNHQGKLGLALLGNASTRLFQLLLYKGKQQPIASARISAHFQFTVQEHLYASFYDDRRQNWSILFESKDNAVDFATQLAVARYRATDPSEETIISQEILPGSGCNFQEGDTVQLKLSAQPFSVSTVQAVDVRQSLMKCALTHKLTNSGWAAGLVGAAPGSSRLILVPLKINLPWLTSKRNEPLLIEVNIDSDKIDIASNSKELSSAVTQSNKDNAAVTGVDSALDSSTEESSIRARGASIKEALTNSPRANKASIISRMARMGQATLPLKGAVTCNPSDSEETEEDSGTTGGTKPPLKVRPVKTRSGPSSVRHQSSAASTSIDSTSTVSVLQSPSSWNQLQQNVLGQVVSLSSQQLPLVAAQSTVLSPSDPTPHISMLLSEARIQNTEIRMHLSKFGDKLDQLTTKVDNLQTPSMTPGSVAMGGAGLEPTVLLSSIEKLVRDNQSLQAEVVEKNKRLEEQNDRIFSLLNTNSKFLEQSSSFLEVQQKQEQQQQKQEQQQLEHQQQLQLIHQMKEEKTSLGNQLASLQNQLATVQELVQALQKSNTDLNQELNLTRCQLQEKEKSLREVEFSKKSLQTEDKIFQLNQALDEQKALNVKLQEQIASEHAKFETDKILANDKYMKLEQKHLDEVSQVKEQISKGQADHFSNSISLLEAECAELKMKLAMHNNEHHPTVDSMITQVKLLMNTLYRGLNQQFTPGHSYDGGQIRTVIASTIKKEALEFVEELEKQYQYLAEESVNINLNTPKPKSEYSSSISVDKVESLTDSTNADKANQVKQSVCDLQSTQFESTSETEAVAQTSHIPGRPTEKAVLESSEALSEDKKDQDSFLERLWRPQPPPPPLFFDDDDSDDCLT